jgi:hypothetical protein
MMEVQAHMNVLVIHVCRLKGSDLGRGLRTRRRGIRALGIKYSNLFFTVVVFLMTLHTPFLESPSTLKCSKFISTFR